jgi:hypothetical protein
MKYAEPAVPATSLELAKHGLIAPYSFGYVDANIALMAVANNSVVRGIAGWWQRR